MFQGWLELTAFLDTAKTVKVYVKADFIVCFYSEPDGPTVVRINNNSVLYVRETADELIELLELRKHEA